MKSLDVQFPLLCQTNSLIRVRSFSRITFLVHAHYADLADSSCIMHWGIVYFSETTRSLLLIVMAPTLGEVWGFFTASLLLSKNVIYFSIEILLFMVYALPHVSEVINTNIIVV